MKTVKCCFFFIVWLQGSLFAQANKDLYNKILCFFLLTHLLYQGYLSCQKSN